MQISVSIRKNDWVRGIDMPLNLLTYRRDAKKKFSKVQIQLRTETPRSSGEYTHNFHEIKLQYATLVQISDFKLIQLALGLLWSIVTQRYQKILAECTVQYSCSRPVQACKECLLRSARLGPDAQVQGRHPLRQDEKPAPPLPVQH